MSEIRFRVTGIPQPKGSAKAFKHRYSQRIIVHAANRGKLKGWEMAVWAAALPHRPKIRLMGPVFVSACFYLPQPKSTKRDRPFVKPDLDKLLRGALDPLTGLLFNDDSQIVAVVAEKWYCNAQEPPGAEIVIQEIAR